MATAPEPETKLDLEEGKRLLEAMTPGTLEIGDGGTDYEPCLQTHKPSDRTRAGYEIDAILCRNLSPEDAAGFRWLRNNAKPLLAEAEEARKLRKVIEAMEREASSIAYGLRDDIHPDYQDRLNRLAIRAREGSGEQ